MKRAYKYRIYPTDEQKKYFSICFAANRWFWNYSLNKIQAIFDANKDKEEKDKIPSVKFEIARELPSLKKEENTCWIKQAESTLFSITGENLDGALQRFFKKKGGFPKFKNAKYSNSYSTDMSSRCENVIDWKNETIKIPKIGNVKCIFHRKFNGKIKKFIISKKSYDYYEISILVDDTFVSQEKKEHTENGTIGIDMGSKEGNDGGNAILSDGTRFNVVEDIKGMQQRLKRLKRKLSKKQWFKNGEKKFSRKYNKEVDVKIPSKNYIKLKNKIAKIEDKISRKREYNTHQISSFVTKNNNYDTIAIEDLNVKGMARNHYIAKSILNANMGELRRQLEYKSEWYGKNLVMVDRFFASTKICNVCGNKYDVGTKREWVCPICGTHHMRDVNAAINIKKEGHRILTEGKQ